jgi:GAF domain-containing protein
MSDRRGPAFFSVNRRTTINSKKHLNMKALLPENEIERLAALRSYQILDTPPDTEFDLLTALASQICGTPIAMLSLVDENRQWFKSKIGVSISETQRDIAFCAHAILQRDVMEVDDARADRRFADNPLVVSPPNIRFYAGAPLVTKEGCALGVMCVLDRKPRAMKHEQRTGLSMLSQLAMAILDFRKKLGEVSKMAAEREWLIAELKQALAKAEGSAPLNQTGHCS